MWTPQRREVVALVAMLDLSVSRDEWTKTQAIAERHVMPLAFLEQIVSRLCQEGLLRSRRGPTGGLRLARAPADIRIADVLRAVVPRDTTAGTPTPRTLEALAHRALGRAGAELERTLDGLTLERLADEAEQLGLGMRPKSALSFDI